MADVTTTTKTTSASTTATTKKAPGLSLKRFFTSPGISPYDELQWELRTAQITDSKGEIFEQKDVEVPEGLVDDGHQHRRQQISAWTLDTPERETGVRQLVGRVAETIRDWGIAGGYFHSAEDAAVFHDELVYLLLHQYAAFNSPVWFNVGCDRLEPNSDAPTGTGIAARAVEFGATGYKKPQCSACFINTVDDTMESILGLAKTEGMLFKYGSGTGTNLSPLRSSKESSPAAAPPAARSAS